VPNIIPELDRRGFSPAEIAQMMGGNWMRIFGETFKPNR
jgi:microsomal dipeptidase-like Zn-dependent dipeptidase